MYVPASSSVLLCLEVENPPDYKYRRSGSHCAVEDAEQSISSSQDAMGNYVAKEGLWMCEWKVVWVLKLKGLHQM